MTLQEYTESLSRQKQFQLAIKLAKLALPIWEQYAQEDKLTFRDRIIGFTFSVDGNLLHNSVEAVEKHFTLGVLERFIHRWKTLSRLRHQFDDPVFALQNEDLWLPNEVFKTLFAVYNLMEAALGKKKTVAGFATLPVSINQAVDALESSNTIEPGEMNKIIVGEK